ncbi:NUDIX hydrolase [Oscillatoriales cyanobacterium USR001]|nr:NUDIX hydrolase [Oscillatoriales cyanobacterium USR001]
MAREPIPTWYFALVVVHLESRFLMVQECKHDQQWYVPAGRVEVGESLIEAAQRNTLQEAGIPIVIEGILRFEHTVMPKGRVRVRVIFVARPEDHTPPKSKPDEYSLGAGWYSPKELDQLSLRGEEIREMIYYMASGAPVYPLELLSFEGAPFKRSRYRW